MKHKYRNSLLIGMKIIIAMVLLAWVLGKVYWRDYVQSGTGESYAVICEKSVAGRVEYEVATGMLWWRGSETISQSELHPLDVKSGKYVRMGFASSIRSANIALLITATFGILIGLLIVTVRWWLLLGIQGINVRLWEVIRLSFLGQFFNYIVPGTVGGDLVKAYYVSKHVPDKKAAVLVSVFIDRVLGFTALAMMAAVVIVVVLVARLRSFTEMRRSVFVIIAVIAAISLMLIFLLSGRFRRILHLQKLYRRFSIAHHISAMGDAVGLYRKNLKLLCKAVVLSMTTHVFFIGSIALIGISLSLPVPWFIYFVFVPLICIAGVVPLTPGGVGLIEGLYVAFFVSATCGASEVLVLALLVRFLPMVWALPGIVVAVTGPKLPSKRTLQTELDIEQISD